MLGRRVPDNDFLHWHSESRLKPGDYGRMDIPRENNDLGCWWFMSPNGLIGRIATEKEPDKDGKHHEVEIHDDGTISILPRLNNNNSILVSDGRESWHGYIRHGVWEKL